MCYKEDWRQETAAKALNLGAAEMTRRFGGGGVSGADAVPAPATLPIHTAALEDSFLDGGQTRGPSPLPVTLPPSKGCRRARGATLTATRRRKYLSAFLPPHVLLGFHLLYKFKSHTISIHPSETIVFPQEVLI